LTVNPFRLTHTISIMMLNTVSNLW